MANKYGIGDGIYLGKNVLGLNPGSSLADGHALVGTVIDIDFVASQTKVVTASDPDSATDPDGDGPIETPIGWKNLYSNYREEEVDENGDPIYDQSQFDEGHSRDDVNVDVGETIRFDENLDGVIDGNDDNHINDATEWGRITTLARYSTEVTLSDGSVLNAAVNVYFTSDGDEIMVFTDASAAELNQAMAAGSSYIDKITLEHYTGYGGATAFDLTESLNQANFTNEIVQHQSEPIVGMSQLCFSADDFIETDYGSTRIDRLEVGDRVLTMDSGPQTVRWIGRATRNADELTRHPKFRPVLIRAGSLGCGRPMRDMRVSRNHRLLVRGAIAKRMFSEEEILVEAKFLLEQEGIEIDSQTSEITYVHLWLGAHHIVRVNGAWAETLYLGNDAKKMLCESARRENMALFPELADMLSSDRHVDPARPLISGKIARNMVARHIRNSKPLYVH